VRQAVHPLGFRIRAGVHTGEIERRHGEPPRGIAVHTGARIAAAASADEILVSSTTHDLVAGSGLTFAPHRDLHLKGIGQQRVHAAVTSPPSR
jgi:class 3 adenylate cyclase